MFCEEKFCYRKRKRIEVTWTSSLNLAPESEWSKEEERVNITLSPEAYEDERRLHLKLSRAEALKLGEVLTSYGKRKLEGEE